MYKLVCIRWLDSQQSSGWQPLPELRHEVVHARSVGWVLYEDDSIIQITAHIGEESGGMSKQICGHMTIPKCAIKETTVIPQTTS